MEILGKQVMGLGFAIVAMGAAIWLSARLPWLRLGHLPGDISVHRPGFSFYFPLGTCVLLSLVLTTVLLLLRLVRH